MNNKILSIDSNCAIAVMMQPKFDGYNTSITEILRTLI